VKVPRKAFLRVRNGATMEESGTHPTTERRDRAWMSRNPMDVEDSRGGKSGRRRSDWGWQPTWSQVEYLPEPRC
jgi:hypothetical protein